MNSRSEGMVARPIRVGGGGRSAVAGSDARFEMIDAYHPWRRESGDGRRVGSSFDSRRCGLGSRVNCSSKAGNKSTVDIVDGEASAVDPCSQSLIVLWHKAWPAMMMAARASLATRPVHHPKSRRVAGP
jgi:hypothetical protein